MTLRHNVEEELNVAAIGTSHLGVTMELSRSSALPFQSSRDAFQGCTTNFNQVSLNISPALTLRYTIPEKHKQGKLDSCRYPKKTATDMAFGHLSWSIHYTCMFIGFWSSSGRPETQDAPSRGRIHRAIRV